MFTGRTDAEAPIFGYLTRRADSLAMTLMLGKTEGRSVAGRGTPARAQNWALV